MLFGWCLFGLVLWIGLQSGLKSAEWPAECRCSAGLAAENVVQSGSIGGTWVGRGTWSNVGLVVKAVTAARQTQVKARSKLSID